MSVGVSSEGVRVGREGGADPVKDDTKDAPKEETGKKKPMFGMFSAPHQKFLLIQYE